MLDNNVPNKSTQESEAEDDDDKLFVGLVAHTGISQENMEKAKRLGQQLAETLANKGALKVMAKAQAIVHGQMNEVVVKS